MKKRIVSALLIAATLLTVLCSCSLFGRKDADTGRGDASDKTSPVLDPVDPDVVPESRASFLAVGDDLVHPNIYMDAKKNAIPGGRAYNFKPAFDNIADMIKNADIAFINQETPMAGASFGYSGYPHFNSPQDLGYDLVELGFDIINIANNHMLDKGASGLKGTIDFLRTLDATYVGGYIDSEDASNIRVIERNGIKIAILSYTYGTNGLSLPRNSDLVIPYIDDALIEREIAAAKQISDAIIVSMHWGTENMFEPNAEQKRLAQLLADNGVLAIIGHHPHVIQPVEWITGENGNKTLCVYSLGNIVSGMNYAYHMVGGIITFDIVKSGGAVSLENVLFRPTVFYYKTSWYGSKIYLLEDFTSELAASHGIANYGKNHLVPLSTYISYATNTIASEFLPEEFRSAA